MTYNVVQYGTSMITLDKDHISSSYSRGFGVTSTPSSSKICKPVDNTLYDTFFLNVAVIF